MQNHNPIPEATLPRPARVWVQRSLGSLMLALALGTLTAVGSILSKPAPHPVVVEPETELHMARVRSELAQARSDVAELRSKLYRANAIAQYSAAYDVPVDLAGKIYDAALVEAINPSLGFQLVKVESGFQNQAKSNRGALGLTQILLPTAQAFQPGLSEQDLLVPETNLRLGFRFLRRMLRQFDSDLEMALKAYNLGPTRAAMTLTDTTTAADGSDYAAAVMKGLKKVRLPRAGTGS